MPADPFAGLELAVEVHELREAIATLLTNQVVITEGINELVAFANRTDATIAGMRKLLGESPIKAMKLLPLLRQS